MHALNSVYVMLQTSYTVSTDETSVNFYEATWRSIPKIFLLTEWDFKFSGRRVRSLELSSGMMEAARTSETSVDKYFKRPYIPENNSEFLLTHHHEILKSHSVDSVQPVNHISPLRWCYNQRPPHLFQVHSQPLSTDHELIPARCKRP
jgi:hypothetical protein